MPEKMIPVEFLCNYMCYEKGDKRDCLPHFAKTLIDLRYAKKIEPKKKRVTEPKKDKMVGKPQKMKDVAV